jgi:hypothetical protein
MGILTMDIDVIYNNHKKESGDNRTDLFLIMGGLAVLALANVKPIWI